MVAILVGGSGLVGRSVLQNLIADREIERIIAIGRRPIGIKNAKLVEIEIHDFSDLKKSDLREKLKGDIYICCLGTTIKKAKSQSAFRAVDLDAVVDFGQLAKHHQASSMVVISASGANAKSRVFYNRVKGEMEERLQALALSRLVIFRPALLMGEREEERPMEKAFIHLAKRLSPWLPEALARRLMTRVDVLAKRIVIEAKITERGLNIIAAEAIE